MPLRIIHLTIFLVSVWLVAAVPAVAAPVAAPEEIGRIVTFVPHGWVERGGAKQNLALKSPLYKSDTVATDDLGKMQILFADDTTVTVAPGSRIELKEFVYDDVNPSFAMRVTSGISRVVTGMIVKKNPDGFQVLTKHSTIGIRGTDCSIIVGQSGTTVVANRINTHDIVVTNAITGEQSRITTTGMAVTASPAGNTPPRPATDQEKVTATQAMRSQGTTTSTAKNEEQKSRDTTQTAQASGQGAGQTSGQSTAEASSGQDGMQSPSPGQTVAAASPEQIPSFTAQDAVKKDYDEQDKKDQILPPGPIDPGPPPIVALTPQDIQGSFSGALQVTRGTNYGNGSFAFNVGLNSGRISDASISIPLSSDGTFQGERYGGSGQIDGNLHFNVNDWQGGNKLYDSSLQGQFNNQNGYLDALEWESKVQGGATIGGVGSDFTHSPEMTQPGGLSPQQISGTYRGGLIGNDNTIGRFDFKVGINTGRISNAEMIVTDRLLNPIYGFNGGSGTINPSLQFSVQDWQTTHHEGDQGKLSGQFNQNGQLPGVSWEANDASGNSHQGTGTTVTQPAPKR